MNCFVSVSNHADSIVVDKGDGMDVVEVWDRSMRAHGWVPMPPQQSGSVPLPPARV